MAFPYSWLPAYQQLTNYLADHRSNQLSLISSLKNIGFESLPDKATRDGENIPLQEIDPFTFFSLLNRFQRDDKRIKYLNATIKELNLPCDLAKDVFGLPFEVATSSYYFAQKFERGENDIDLLWDLFYQAKDNKIEEELFSKVLDIKFVGLAKLSFALFYVNPKHYIPLDRYAKDLATSQGFNPEVKNFFEYKELCLRVCDKMECTPWEFSFEAWARAKLQDHCISAQG